MKKLKLFPVALSLIAILLLVSNALAGTMNETFYAAGSSAQFNTFEVAVGTNVFGGGPLYGTHHWSKKSTSSLPITLNDPRSSSIAAEPANIWVVWNDAAAINGGSGALTWAASTAYTAGQVILPLTSNGYYFVANTSGTSGTTEPSWPTSTGTVVDNGVTWRWEGPVPSGTPDNRIAFYASVDSIVGVRCYMASCTLSLPTGLIGSADQQVVPAPLMPVGEQGLPNTIQAQINGATLNTGMTDIRPEDAKMATLRDLTAYGTQMTGRGVTGLGYGPGPIGTAIQSSQDLPSATVANPVDFAILQGDTDPICSLCPIRKYVEIYEGAAPVLVIANVSNTASGHLGDGNFTNINRFVLARVLEGLDVHTRDIATTGASFNSGTGLWSQSLPDVAFHVWIRESLSGTYNTMEWCIPNSREIDADNWGPGVVAGQDNNLNPSITTGSNPACSTACSSRPCSGSNTCGNPLWQTTDTTNGSTRARVIGTGEMISTVNSNADSIGYAFWSYPSFAGKANLKYLTVDGVDPFYSGPSANPNGDGVIPTCSSLPCPTLTFPNIVNGTYPIWSKYRMIYNAYDTTNTNQTVVNYAIQVNNPTVAYVSGETGGAVFDFVPPSLMQVFRSHYSQVVTTSGGGLSPNNGFKFENYEAGGDAGGAVLTINSEIDFNNDTGNQQVEMKQ